MTTRAERIHRLAGAENAELVASRCPNIYAWMEVSTLTEPEIANEIRGLAESLRRTGYREYPEGAA